MNPHPTSPFRKLAGAFLLAVLVSGGIQGAIAPSAHAGQLQLQGATLQWDENAFVKPNGCGNFSFNWANNTGRDLLSLEVKIMHSRGSWIYWEWQIPARNGQTGTFNDVICDYRLPDGLGPYRIDFIIEDYSFLGGGAFVASAPLTFFATAPPPAAVPPPAAAPEAPAAAAPVPRAPRRPTGVKVKIDGTSARVSWRANASADDTVRYEVTAFPGGKSCSTRSDSCLIKGLKRGSEYQFTIVATNSVGASPTATSKVVRIPQAQSSRPSAPQRPSRPAAPAPPPKPEAGIS